jgi:hypothetical protein
VATAGGVLLGLIGPFGSFFNGPAWQRVVYWLAMAWLTLVLLELCNRPMARLALWRRRPWARRATAAAVASIPLSAASWFLARAIWPGLRQVPDLTPGAWLLQGLTITLATAAVFALAQRRLPVTEAASQPQPSQDLLGAAPAEVLCLMMEDHYVRVHTSSGSHLVAATLTQAVAALRGAAGLQVHRSWWVAEDAVAGSVLAGRNFRLRLSNGMEAPVARSFVATVRVRGWLERRAEQE